MNKRPPLTPMIITQIDEEIEKLQPIMDDVDAGIEEGLRRAREIVCQTERARWGEAFCEYKDTSGSF